MSGRPVEEGACIKQERWRVQKEVWPHQTDGGPSFDLISRKWHVMDVSGRRACLLAETHPGNFPG